MKKIAIILQILLVSTLITSCSEDYLDVNTDPNNPTEVSPDLVLPVALVYSANLLFDSGGETGRSRKANTLGNLIMYNWSQSDGYSWYTTEFQYLVTNTFYDAIWEYSYQNVLQQYEVLQRYGDNAGNYKAISKIMQAFHFQMLVDAYGDIPYSEALQRSEIPTPAFDDAEAVYDSLIVDLTAAIDTINATAENPDALVPGQDDILFGGDMERWKKLANTIKLRILIRQSGMADKQAYIQEQFAVIANEGSGFLTEDAIINPGFTNQVDKRSPFWESFGPNVSGDNISNYLATTTTPYVINLLQSTNDPRIDRLFEEPETGHLGVVQGLLEYPIDGSLEPDHVSNFGPGLLKSPEMGSVLMLAAESYFLQAEAALDGYIAGDAQALYEMGITASFDYLGVEEAETEAAAYYSQPIENVGWEASPNKLEAIITQKWLALNSINGFESWIEFNRTGFPDGLPLPLTTSHDSRPVRLLYPASAISANGENVPPQDNSIAFTDKIFWAN